jgi:dTDP-4-dehydrorhamnose 3,5-epimerase
MGTSAVNPTSIEGLLLVDLDVFPDERGWFKESYQREKLEAAGLPRLEVVQHNVSFNAARGVIRGIHAEPWDKYVSPATGRVFAAIVDLRDGPAFGEVATFELGPEHGLYIPRGCGNSFCTLDASTAYSYLVNAHWSPDSVYTNVSLFDTDLAIAWPIPREEMTVSEKDLAHPPLRDVKPIVL